MGNTRLMYNWDRHTVHVYYCFLIILLSYDSDHGKFCKFLFKKIKSTNCQLPARKFYKKFDAVHSPKFLVVINGGDYHIIVCLCLTKAHVKQILFSSKPLFHDLASLKSLGKYKHVFTIFCELFYQEFTKVVIKAR